MIMSPPEPSCPAFIGFDSTDEQIFMALGRMGTGSPLPDNVIDVVDPYVFIPDDMPDGIWYLFKSKENIGTECGYWKNNGEACEVYSNSNIIGWRATLQYYVGQAPHESKTAWLMQVFSITQKIPCENSMEKEASMLCRVFRGGEQSSDQNMQQKTSVTDNTTTQHNNSIEQLILRGDGVTRVHSTSEAKVNKDYETVPFAVRERVIDHRVENAPEADYISSEDDYLELLDLDDPASPSSSENSSCVTMSSDECFDSLALLQELEPETDQVLEQRNADYRFNLSVSHKPTKTVMLPATSGQLAALAAYFNCRNRGQ
ncbi:hypothetical protein SLEP1_g16897 [Rubroshorea leprosula]|uniref:NAC domain-containing protein n=2 Tax=Rubroshorea leprosula TaxID=152421 RepID=A0AAV5ISD7_9ROSI|nr:hypothetical protein SLEP1_g16897 [Rubroshorea leprosula]